MGLRLLAFVASLSLMVIGFGALGASPASAEDLGSTGGNGIYAPNQCTAGYAFKDGKCVKTTTYTPVPPAVSWTGSCGWLAATEETATEESLLGYEFDPSDGKCKKAGWPSFEPRDRQIVLTCDTANDWYLKDLPKATDAVEAEHSGSKMCVKDDTYEYADPTCRDGDTLVPGEKGSRCYTPKAICEMNGGEWGSAGQPGKADNEGFRSGKCWMPINFDICQFTPTEKPRGDHDADEQRRHGNDEVPLVGTYALVNVLANYTDRHGGQYAADWPEPMRGAITPLVQDPADPTHNVSVAEGDQAFLARGCKDAVPETPTPVGGPTPVTDFCPNVAGVQWENYDCATGTAPQAVAAAEAVLPVAVPAPATVPAPAKKPAKPTKVPTTVAAPQEATVPSAVPAGGGSTVPSGNPPTWAVALLLLGALGLAASALRMAGSLLR
jgi:hypothetical protein